MSRSRKHKVIFFDGWARTQITGRRQHPFITSSGASRPTSWFAADAVAELPLIVISRLNSYIRDWGSCSFSSATTVDHPKVTALLPVVNGERLLREAVDSVLRQTWIV